MCGKPWCEKDARDVLEEDLTVSYGDGGGENNENRDFRRFVGWKCIIERPEG